MAIKVGGTSVISDSRVLENVTGLKTINSTSILGSGNISAGASTTAGAVGTYILGRPLNTTNYSRGSTATGVRAATFYDTGTLPYVFYSSTAGGNWSGSLSGTWRTMTGAYGSGNYGYVGIWVRIS